MGLARPDQLDPKAPRAQSDVGLTHPCKVKLLLPEHPLPILGQSKAGLDREKQNERILPKSPIREAVAYMFNQWNALVRYTEEGVLSFDNNMAERLVIIPAIGRKNYFLGSENGGHGAVRMYSLVSSVKAKGVESFVWLRDLLTQLPYHRNDQTFVQALQGVAST